MNKIDGVNVNDKIRTWCAGSEVVGSVIYKNNSCFIVEHKPVIWGKDTYTKTIVRVSTPLQKIFYSETTPFFEKI